MQLKLVSFVLAVAAIASVGFVVSAHSQSVTYKEKVLYSFKGGIVDGGNPYGGLVLDAEGNLYGTAQQGGINGCSGFYGCGAIYKLDTTGKETILYFFTGGSDGGTPLGGLVRDAQGNLYGTTSQGGNGLGCGTVYKLDSTNQLTVIYTFPSCYTGANFGPQSGLARDAEGNLYGTTYTDGNTFLGTIFKIDSSATFSILHSFSGWEGGVSYLSPFTLGPDGNLYGVTTAGGSSSAGVVFKISPKGKYTVLYSFTGGPDGYYATGSLAVDSSDNVYGATYSGGSSSGVAYEVAETGEFSVLHTFSTDCSPSCGGGGTYGGGLIQDDAGNLYGTTAADGYGAGTVFMIDVDKKFHNLHSFTGGDGSAPYAPVIRDANGDLYGTTSSGGEFEQGIVFELSPN
jgi:uncharacterized repeat protein (TIGR03803 family)